MIEEEHGNTAFGMLKSAPIIPLTVAMAVPLC